MDGRKLVEWKYYIAGGVVGLIFGVIIFLEVWDNPALFIAGPAYGLFVGFIISGLAKGVTNAVLKIVLIILFFTMPFIPAGILMLLGGVLCLAMHYCNETQQNIFVYVIPAITFVAVNLGLFRLVHKSQEKE